MSVRQRSNAAIARAMLMAALVLLVDAGAATAQAPGRAPATAGQTATQDEGVQRMAREMIPLVERAVGLTFKRPPVVAVRSRDQVRAYLDHKIEAELSPAELSGVQRAYRALGLVPDTIDLRRLMLDLYGEQVAGFYEPDSSALYVVRGAEPLMVRLVLAHELVHALQDQYTDLNAILRLRRQNDRQMAGQAVAEGQATLASMRALAPGMDEANLSALWRQNRQALRSQQEAMPVFARAPRMLQEDLIFPYVYGADFVHAFEGRRAAPGEQPYGARMPISTEQILHPSKYTARERPARVRLAALPGDTLVYDDDFGEFDVGVALESWGTPEPDALVAASGWNGDRFAAYGSRVGTALVWVTAWDTPDDAGEFEAALRQDWQRRTGAAEGAYVSKGSRRRWRIDRFERLGVPVVRLSDAPAAWAGWRTPPGVSVTPAR